jgi:hypothetical protein
MGLVWRSKPIREAVKSKRNPSFFKERAHTIYGSLIKTPLGKLSKVKETHLFSKKEPTQYMDP